MAIIRSLGIGRARKSAGDITYRTIRGRTIGSQKRGKADTRLVSLSKAQAIFGMVSMFMMAHATDIEVSFDKSRYGSQRNYFFRTNKAALEEALAGLLPSVMSSATYPPLVDIESAITSFATNNPNRIYRVKLQGFDLVYLNGAWSSADNPISGGAVDGLGKGSAVTVSSDGTVSYTAPTEISMSYYPGARIVRNAGRVTLTGSAIPANITAGDIEYLTSNGVPVSQTITISNVTSNAGNLTYTATEITEAMTALAVRVGQVYVRLSSAYVRGGGEDGDNPLG